MRSGASKLLMLLSTPFPLPLRLTRHSRLFFASASVPRRHHHHLSSSPRNPRLSFNLRAEIHSQVVESAAEPWPEWARLVESVGACGEGGVGCGDDELESLPRWFVRDARACLAFARQRPELLRLLPRKDIEVVVENGSPFLFKDALNSSRRMRSFLGGQDDSEMTSEKAETVDIVRYLLGYVYNQLVLSEKYSNTELVEASVRNLFTELVNISGQTSPHLNMPIYGQAPSDLNMPIDGQTTYGLDQPQRQQRQNVEMKRGDWICSKCNFMNFARNSKCLECNEGRPKRQLAGGEWECPQCDFFNYGRNMVCLRCDCKRPEQKGSSPTPHTNTDIEYGDMSSFEKVYARSSSDNSEIERRLAENDAKAERWFSKVSQLGDSADLSSAIADEDFPEIMPLRKGVNRFVVSTKKTPLERRLANENFKRNAVSGLSNDNYTPSSAESSINKTLDRILGQSSTASGKGSDSSHQSTTREVNSGTEGDSLRSRDPGYVPFVPLSADKFRKPQTEGQQSYGGANPDTLEPTRGYSASKSIESETNILPNDKPENVVGNSDVSRSSDHQSERWSKKGVEVDDTNNLPSAVPDDDFPDIMPVRKGENRFVISKKKDRSLTSPQYKRRLAMEQSIDSNFVPFVPFPPDYFAKKDKQPESENPNMKTDTGNANESPRNVSEPKSPDPSFGSNISNPGSQSQSYGASRSTTDPLYGRSSDTVQSGSSSWANKNESWVSKSFEPSGQDAMNAAHSTNASSWNANSERTPQSSWNNVNIDTNSGSSRRVESSNIYGNQPSNPQQNNNNDNKGQGGQFSTSTDSGPTNNSERLAQQTTNSQSRQNDWNGGFSGKSLEGSAVTEPDPLDMSEEAKAQRWFRRVAQITDISELSKIPDEDFPEIMPMRKGVNRFVVSKRKTPLERRLTSPQYRRNLPIVSSDPEKDSNRGSS